MEIINFKKNELHNSILPSDWFQNITMKVFFDSNIPILENLTTPNNKVFLQKLAIWLSNKYNNKINSDQLFLTNGVDETVVHLINKYNEASDTIIVESPSCSSMIGIFKEYGLNIAEIEMEEDGIYIEELEQKLINLNSKGDDDKQGVIFYYMNPTFQNPTGITTSHDKRKELAKLCEKYSNFYIIADESYHFLNFNEYDYNAMADYHPKIISLGSFSKIFTPGLHVGWIYQNTDLYNFKLDYSFISGSSGLNKSAIVEGIGKINPFTYKYIEHVFEDDYLDSHINKIKTFIQSNSMIVCEFLSQFDNIEYIKPTGGYYIWVRFKTVKNMNEFLKICEKNKVIVMSGNKFSQTTVFNNFARLSFSHYDSNNIMLGLERLMDSVVNYNSINVKIAGFTGNQADCMLIKSYLLTTKGINYMGDINDNFDKEEFNNMISYNSVIIDMTESYGLLDFLIENKIYLPIIICSNQTINKISLDKYISHAPVIIVKNFFESNQILDDIITKLGSNWKIQNNNNMYELNNGSEIITITNKVINRESFAKNCLHHVYMLLTLQPKLYYKLVDIDMIKYDNIYIYNMKSELHELVINYIVNKKYENIKDNIVIFRENNKKIELRLFTSGSKINYCYKTLINMVSYINDNYQDEGVVYINNDSYNFKYSKTTSNAMIELPILDFVDNKKSVDKMIHNIINEMTNMTLLGIGKYKYNDMNYIVLEIKEDILDCDMLDSITTIINDTTKYNIAYMSYNETETNSVYLRCFDSNTNTEIDNSMLCSYLFSCVHDYYLFHFMKGKKDNFSLKFEMPNNIINTMYYKETTYIYEKTN